MRTEFKLTENTWRAVILGVSCAVLMVTAYCLSQGITIIFMHLYYLPIVLLAYLYQRKGFYLSVLLGLLYLVLVAVLVPGDIGVFEGAVIRAIVFIVIAALVAYLTGQLTEAQDALGRTSQVRQIFEGSPIGMALVTPDFRFSSVNPAWVSMTGYSEDELLKMSFTDITHPDYLAGDLENIRNLVAGSIPVYSTEKRYIRKDKSILWGYLMVTAIQDPKGSVRYFSAQIEDISQRKQVEDALRESEEKYRLLAETSPEMIYLIDNDGYVKYVNQTAARQFHAAPDELAGKHLSEIFSPETVKNHLNAIRKVVADRKVIRREITEEFPVGSVSIDVRLAPVINNHDQVIGVLGLSNDITPRKQAEEQREALIRELGAKNAELDRFTYTVSHDLKSPLLSIRGFLSLLEGDIKSGDTERVATDILRMSESAEKLEHLITTLLALSRSGRSVDMPVRVPFADLAREAAQMLDASLKERGVTLVIPESMPVVTGDRQRLVQVMTNLLDNAVRFMGDHKDPRVEISVRTDAGTQVFCVLDNGMGIKPDNLEKVFGLYERFNPEIPGTGIGLATVKRIIEAHGGKVWVESEGEGKGTTVCFTLPVAGGSGTDNNNNA
jgi:PAS domain S-box-containing protein